MNQEHLYEFFELLNEPYDNWLKEAQRGNRRAPIFDISKQLAGTIFSYDGFDTTANHRDQSIADEIVSRMLTESINGPTLLVDWGTFDGRRLHKILSNIPNDKQEQIKIIYGIDLNKKKLSEATKLFANYSSPFETIEKRIEFLDYSKLAKHANSQELPLRKITLALDNISMNFNGLSSNPEEGINGFLKKSHRAGDIIIMQTHSTVNGQIYADRVEEFFKNYYKESGLENLLGGELFASYWPWAKTIHIEQLNEKVKFNGKTYSFPWGIQDADPATIKIGFSGCIPSDDMNRFLLNNYANNFVLLTKNDVSYVKSDVILRLKYRETHESKFVPSSELQSICEEKLT
jgi:hypothetical protein